MCAAIVLPLVPACRNPCTDTVRQLAQLESRSTSVGVQIESVVERGQSKTVTRPRASAALSRLDFLGGRQYALLGLDQFGTPILSSHS